MLSKIKNAIFWGMTGGLTLLLFYFLVLTLANSFSHAKEQFSLLWYWMFLLIIGFGIQIGFYYYIRQSIKEKKMRMGTNRELAVSAGTSAGAMVACCAHHLVDVLPILGLSAAFLFLSTYQTLLLILGILSNIIAVIFMLEIIKKHSLHENTGILNKISRFDIKAIRSWSMACAAVILLFSFLIIQNNTKGNIAAAVVSDALSADSELVKPLGNRINDGGGLSIKIKPINFSFDTQVKFDISLNTHQGNLDFDLTEKAVLLDARNNKYLPLEWRGGKGGHHISGVLIFPVIKTTEKIKLIINNVYNVREREFLWDLNEI